MDKDTGSTDHHRIHVLNSLQFNPEINITKRNVSSKKFIDTCISSGIYENVAPENLAILTGTTLKPRFYDSNQPKITRKKGKKERKRAGEDKRLVSGRQKTARCARVQTPRPRVSFSKHQVDI